MQRRGFENQEQQLVNMDMNKRGFANIALIILVVILVGAVGYFALVKKSIQQTPISQNNELSPQPTPSPEETFGWKKYSDSSFSFDYPEMISVKKEGETVTLDHSIAYKHPNPCDFKGDAPPSEKITDFNVSIKIVNKSPKDFIQSNEWPDWDWVSQNPFKFGSLSGFKVSPGVEGCGEDIYYLTISSNKTLVITQPFVTEFTGAIGDSQSYLSLPGIIPPNQAEVFFTKIVSSLKVN